MKKLLKYSHLIGFVLFGLLFFLINKNTGVGIKSIEKVFVGEDQTRNILHANLLLQRALSTLTLTISLNDQELLNTTILTFNEAKKLLSEKFFEGQIKRGIESFEQELLKMQAKLQKGENLDRNDLIENIKIIDGLSLLLSQKESSQLQEVISGQKRFIEEQNSTGLLLKTINIITTIVLTLLMWALIRNDKFEKELIKVQEMYKRVLLSLSEGVIYCDDQGQIMAVNDSAYKILENSRELLLNKNIKLFFGTLFNEVGIKIPDLHSPILNSVMFGRRYFNYTVGLPCEKKIKWLSLSTQTLAGENNQNHSTVISFFDITESVEAQKIIDEQRNQIISQSKLSALGEMATGIAHEINNPLQLIKLNAQSLMIDADEKEQLPSKDVKESMGQIDKTIKRISNIINNMKRLARGGDQEKSEKIAVGKMIDDTLEISGHSLKQQGVILKVKSFDRTLSTFCRPTQIVQVLINLLNNARDAIENLPEKWIEVEVKEIDAFVVFCVTDSGNGIPISIQDKILQPFFTTKETGKGTGLGLSISYRIIKDHGGIFEIDNHCKNTRFIFSIPKAKES